MGKQSYNYHPITVKLSHRNFNVRTALFCLVYYIVHGHMKRYFYCLFDCWLVFFRHLSQRRQHHHHQKNKLGFCRGGSQDGEGGTALLRQGQRVGPPHRQPLRKWENHQQKLGRMIQI